MDKSILGNKKLVQFWLASALNPADDPSRFVDLRSPRPVSDKVRDMLLPSWTQSAKSSKGCHGDKFQVLEIFAGCGALTAALLKIGFGAGQPFEAYPEKKSTLRSMICYCQKS